MDVETQTIQTLAARRRDVRRSRDRHPRERQMHLLFQNGVRLVIGDSGDIPLAAELIIQLRKIERRNPRQEGGRA